MTKKSKTSNNIWRDIHRTKFYFYCFSEYLWRTQTYETRPISKFRNPFWRQNVLHILENRINELKKMSLSSQKISFSFLRNLRFLSVLNFEIENLSTEWESFFFEFPITFGTFTIAPYKSWDTIEFEQHIIYYKI